MGFFFETKVWNLIWTLLKNEIDFRNWNWLLDKVREPDLKGQRVFLIYVIHTTTSDPIASLGYLSCLSGLWSADQNWEIYANLFLFFQMKYVWFLAEHSKQIVIKDSEGLMF